MVPFFLFNENTDDLIFYQTELFQDLFESIIYYIDTISNHQPEKSTLSLNKIKTHFIGSRRLLIITLKLINDARAESVIDCIVEFEFQQILADLSFKMTKEDLSELVLTKHLIPYIRMIDTDSIYDIFRFVCTPQLVTKLIPRVDIWSLKNPRNSN